MSQTIFPALHYRDPDAALRFLTGAFDGREKEVFRDEHQRIEHAELEIAGGLVMFGGSSGSAIPGDAVRPLSLYVVVADPDAHCARARAGGARIVREPQDTPYGTREYGAEDLEGNLWSFGTYDPAK